MHFDGQDGKALAPERVRRLRRASMLLLAFGILAAGAVNAHARDLCMTFSGGGAAVFKRFKIPRPNKCTSIHGFDAPGGYGGVVAGAACTEVDGHSMTLHYTSHARSEFYFEAGMCKINLPMTPNGTIGRCVGQYLAWPAGPDRYLQNVTLTTCDVDVPW